MQKRRTPIECLEFMRNIAQQNGAELLDTEWNKWDSYYSFKLANGDLIKRMYRNFASVGWDNPNSLKKQSHQRLLNELQLIAKNNKGTLLDTEWKGSKHKYCFENEFGDKFYISSGAIKTYGWPKNWDTYLKSNSQSKNTKVKGKYSLKNLHDIAIKNLGKCLESTFLGIDKPHLFEDEFGNHFYSSPRRVLKGFWNLNRGLVTEPICRQVLEHLFQHKFPSTRKILTANLMNREKNLELDGYCIELKIAFEYQGYPSHWDINHKKYPIVHDRDLLKKEWCEKLGIILIEIPVFSKSILNLNSDQVFNHIKNIVMNTFTKLNKPSTTLNLSPFNIQFDKINYNRQQLKVLKDIAQKHGGNLISKIWKISKQTYTFTNNKGEQFEMSMANYLKNGWPNNITKYNNHQAGHRKNDKELLKELKSLALFHNCKLIDKKWNGDTFKYSFKKPDDSIFKKSAASIKKFGLNTKSFTLEDRQKNLLYLNNLAKENKATLIEKEWKGSSYFYSFNINDKIYQINYKFLKNNGWPTDLKKFTINSTASRKTSADFYQELVDFAKKNNGQVLSLNWLGNHTLHEFITEEGIIFKKKPVNIKRSGWYK